MSIGSNQTLSHANLCCPSLPHVRSFMTNLLVAAIQCETIPPLTAPSFTNRHGGGTVGSLRYSKFVVLLIMFHSLGIRVLPYVRITSLYSLQQATLLLEYYMY
jgi:hypothetical protein